MTAPTDDPFLESARTMGMVVGKIREEMKYRNKPLTDDQDLELQIEAVVTGMTSVSRR